MAMFVNPQEPIRSSTGRILRVADSRTIEDSDTPLENAGPAKSSAQLLDADPARGENGACLRAAGTCHTTRRQSEVTDATQSAPANGS